MSAITHRDAEVADQLFATLDPLMARCQLPSGRHVVLSDTVGFISNLPHQLIDAFRATLEEARAPTCPRSLHPARLGLSLREPPERSLALAKSARLARSTTTLRMRHALSARVQVVEAEVLLHVIDASSPAAPQQREAVFEVLRELGIPDQDMNDREPLPGACCA